MATKSDAVTITGAAISVGSGSALSDGTLPQTLSHPVYLGLTLDEWSILGIVFGMAIGLAGWLTNVWFKRQHLRIAQQQAKANADE